MAKFTYQFDSAFTYEISNQRVRKALKEELLSSFNVEESKNTNAMIEYLIENFFWEFTDYFNDELLVIFEESAKSEYRRRGLS